MILSKKTRPLFRPLTPVDVPRALDIIRRFSEEDYDVARYTLQKDLEEQYALEVDGQVAGVTGSRYIDGTEGSHWLSWTYLHEDYRGQGLGQMMLNGIFEVLAKNGARMLFLTTSDLRDTPDGPMLYGPAIKAYQRAGFEEQTVHAAYYTHDEGQIVMGRRLKRKQKKAFEFDHRGAALIDADEIVETDDAWFIDWKFATGAAAANATDVAQRIAEIREEEARVIFVGVPSDAPAVEALFRAAGFRDDGRLTDFYDDGVDEIRLRLDLSAR